MSLYKSLPLENLRKRIITLNNKKYIFICSPYRGEKQEDVRQNIVFAKNLSKIVISEGSIPLTPHLYFPHFLDDSNDNERAIGILAGIQWMSLCSSILMADFIKVSSGMQTEINYNNEHLKLPVRMLSLDSYYKKLAKVFKP